MLALFATVLLGCDVNLRDDYTGQSVFQPGKTAQEVRRDQNGNPILPARR